MPTIGVEWINDYDTLNKLTHEHEDAGGLYDELVDHDGWVGRFNWGDANAWEDDFKRASRGGHAHDWIETCDLVYFTGHGSPRGFYFRSDRPDDSLVECDHHSGPTNGDMRLGSGNLDWLALEVCNTLQMDATIGGKNRDVFDRWSHAFAGLHTILSFTTTSLDLANPGRVFGKHLDGRWIGFGLRAPLRVIDSWFLMGLTCQPDDVESAVLYANAEGTDTANDRVWGHGYVSPDPVPGRGWFAVSWVPHAC
jgi:hypothetical protein